jgi:hypothetical protein
MFRTRVNCRSFLYFKKTNNKKVTSQQVLAMRYLNYLGKVTGTRLLAYLSFLLPGVVLLIIQEGL